MRIQHNIAALNAHRQLGGNNTMVSKNLEKLSSGYKINRAGDDAAGLAISEKMRAQIRGLETASKNANDGISLIQTAEGALTEVHSMLNRMVELSTQSANGTYTKEDRDKLQSEVVSLRSEIDRIAEGTNFNGIKLLNGSLGKDVALAINKTEGATKAELEGLAKTLTDKTNASVTGTKDAVMHKSQFYLADIGKLTETDVAGGADSITFTINYSDDKGTAHDVTLTLAATADGDGLAITAAQVGTVLDTDAASASDNVAAKTGVSGAATALLADAGWVQDATNGTLGQLFNVTVSGKTINFEAKKTAAAGALGNNAGASAVDTDLTKVADKIKINTVTVAGASGATAHLTAVQDQLKADLAAGGSPANVTLGGAAGAATVGAKAVGGTATKASAKFDLTSQIKHNAAFKVGQKTYILKKFDEALNEENTKAGSATENATVIEFGKQGETDADVAAKVALAITNDRTAAIDVSKGNYAFEATAAGTVIQVQETAESAAARVTAAASSVADTSAKAKFTVESQVVGLKTTVTSAGEATLDITIDPTKVKNGTTLKLAGTEYEFVTDTKYATKGKTSVLIDKTDDAATMAKKLVDAVKAKVGDANVASTLGSISSDSAGKITIGSALKADAAANDNGLMLQVGETDEAFQKVGVVVSDMSSKGLGIDVIDVTEEESAAKAMEQVKVAIKAVSTTRSDMGAIQNRLEHTINNLGVTTENMTAAESRIRDVDMAKEMMEFTKNNILTQAAQSMLAQANQLPQGVLQLLR